MTEIKNLITKQSVQATNLELIQGDVILSNPSGEIPIHMLKVKNKVASEITIPGKDISELTPILNLRSTFSPPAPFNNLLDILDWRNEFQSTQKAFIYDDLGTITTYGKLHCRAKAVGVVLQSLKLQGKPVLLLISTGEAFLEAFFGCIYAGSIGVPVYKPKMGGLNRIERIMDDSGAEVGLVSLATYENMRNCPELAVIFQKLQLIPIDTIQNEKSFLWERPDINSESIAFLQYTSGSTTDPKGVMVTHGNILRNLSQIQEAAQTCHSSVCVGWTPLFHDLGLICNVLHPVFVGFPSILMTPTMFLKNPINWLKAITKYKATISGAPNFAYELCVEKITESDLKILDLSSWNIAFNGSEPVRSDTMNRFIETFSRCGFDPNACYPTYGMAESVLFISGRKFGTGIKTIGNLSEKNIFPATIVSCGYPRQDSKISIVDAYGNCVPNLQIGEIWVSGSSIAKGYWKKPKTTVETFFGYLSETDGPYLKTGDLGFIDDSGELYVTGRKKDLFIFQGVKYFPHDIENFLESRHKSIVEIGGCAVFEEALGTNNLIVFVGIQKSCRFDNKLLQEFSSKVEIQVFKEFGIKVKSIICMKPSAIPKTSSGKLRRYECRNMYQTGTFQSIYIHNSEKPENTCGVVLVKNQIESRVEELFERFFGAEMLGKYKTVSEFDAHSMLLAEVIGEIKRSFLVELEMSDILDKTISEISQTLHKKLLLKQRTLEWDLPKKSSPILYQETPLLELFSSGKLGPVDAVAIAYIPEKEARLGHFDQLFLGSLVPVNFLDLGFGKSLTLCLPTSVPNLLRTKSILIPLILDGLRIGKNVGAKVASLTGLLASSTDYGEAITKNIGFDQISLPAPSTGHAATVSSVFLFIKKALSVTHRLPEFETFGFLGLGSIGQASLELVLHQEMWPKKIILCDVPGMKHHLEKIKQEIETSVPHIKVDVAFSHGGTAPKEFYQASIIVGATSVPNILDVEKLSPGSIIIDDSFPHCFDPESAFKRFRTYSDILFTEGGILQRAESIQEIRYWPQEFALYHDELPSLFLNRHHNEITSCMLAGVLSATCSGIMPTIGKISPKCSSIYLKKICQLGFAASDFRLDGISLDSQSLDSFLSRFGGKF